MEPNKEFIKIGQEKALPPCKTLEIGLSWDKFDEKVDLDLTVVLLTNSGQLVDAVYYNKTVSNDGSTVHSGDEKTGEKEGLDEKITVEMEKIANDTKVLAVLVTSPNGQSFQKAETAELVIFVDKKPISFINCGCQGNYESMLSTLFYCIDGTWKLKNICEVGHSRNFVDMLPQITSNMRFLVDEATLQESEVWNTTTGKSYNLKKGNEINLASCLNVVAMGLGWETTCDLDSSVITMDSNFNVIEYVYYGNLHGRNGAIMHQGDNLTGEGQGDDENIVIDLTKIDSNIVYLGCSINVFTSSKFFTDVTEAFCRLIDWKTKAEFCRYTLNESGRKRSCLMCYLRRDSSSQKWKIKAVGGFYDGFDKTQIAKDIQNDIQKEGKREEKTVKSHHPVQTQPHAHKQTTQSQNDNKDEKKGCTIQ